MEIFQQYGCWCYFGDELRNNGRSTPVDDIDALCKVLNQGYQCAVLDAQEEGDNDCQPWNEEYTTSRVALDELDEDCAEKNAGSMCAIRACIIENWFVTNSVMLLMMGQRVDDAKKHRNGFDPELECPVTVCSDMTLNV